MVNLVEDWEVLEDYAGDKQGYYQVLANDGAVEVRVAMGRLGFRKEFFQFPLLGFCLCI